MSALSPEEAAWREALRRYVTAREEAEAVCGDLAPLLWAPSLADARAELGRLDALASAR